MDPIVVPGKCRVCGCTDETPCRDDDGNPCAWVDVEHTLCDKLDCIAQVPMSELEKMTAA
jgi:hypothetical protein